MRPTASAVDGYRRSAPAGYVNRLRKATGLSFADDEAWTEEIHQAAYSWDHVAFDIHFR
jgi:hypothetical protein